jgi:hypothetical protein
MLPWLTSMTLWSLSLFSPKTNFRYEIFPAYKGNRKNKRKPLALSHIIGEVKKRHPNMQQERIEADDLIGIMCTQDPENSIAVSGLAIRTSLHFQSLGTTSSATS